MLVIKLVLFIILINGIQGVKIVKLDVPEIAEYGAQDSVILDCDFIYDDDAPVLVLKWFLNSKMKQVYQWTVSGMPQSMGVLKGRVDLTYKASDDPMSMYRALRITKLDPELSGEYICVVSTFMDEDEKSGRMTVFVPETNFKLIQNKSNDDTVNVICRVDNVYPMPKLSIATKERYLPAKQTRTVVNGKYSVIAFLTLNDADLSTPTEFICTLKVRDVKYSVRKEIIYHPGPINSATINSDVQLGSAVAFKDYFYQALIIALVVTRII